MRKIGPGNCAQRELKVQMAQVDRKFYAGRSMSVLACRCLINDAVRHALNKPWKPSTRAAQPGRKMKAKGRPIV